MADDPAKQRRIEETIREVILSAVGNVPISRSHKLQVLPSSPDVMMSSSSNVLSSSEELMLSQYVHRPSVSGHGIYHPARTARSPTTTSQANATTAVNNSVPSLVNLGAPARTYTFEDLPENFLENVSPTGADAAIAGPSTIVCSAGSSGIFPPMQSLPSSNSPTTLASLTPVNLVDQSLQGAFLSTGQQLSMATHHVTTSAQQQQQQQQHSSTAGMLGLTPLIPMAVTVGNSSSLQQVATGGQQLQSTYVMTAMKLEPSDCGNAASNGQNLAASCDETATILSPLALPISSAGALASHSAAAPGDLLNLPPVLVEQNGTFHYVKVEMAPSSVGDSLLGHNAGTTVRIVPRTALQTPPNVATTTTAELANNIIATMLNSPGNNCLESYQEEVSDSPVVPMAAVARKSIGGRHRTRSDAAVNVGEDDGDDIYIDTRELCKRIAYELKQHSIPQAIFAERVLCR